MKASPLELRIMAEAALPKRRDHKRRALLAWVDDFAALRSGKVKRAFKARIAEPLALEYIERLLLSQDTDGHSVNVAEWIRRA